MKMRQLSLMCLANTGNSNKITSLVVQLGDCEGKKFYYKPSAFYIY